MVSGKTFTAYLSVYELANYSAAKHDVSYIFRWTFGLSRILAKAPAEITNITCIFLDWFSQTLNRDLDSS